MSVSLPCVLFSGRHFNTKTPHVARCKHTFAERCPAWEIMPCSIVRFSKGSGVGPGPNTHNRTRSLGKKRSQNVKKNRNKSEMSWTPILRTFPLLASCDQGIINSCKCYHGGRMDGRGRSDKASFTPSIFIVIGAWRCLVSGPSY